MIADPEDQKPDPTTISPLPLNAPAPSAALVLEPMATSSSSFVTTSQPAGSQGAARTWQTDETSRVSGDEAGIGASLPVTGSLVASPDSTQFSRIPSPPSTFGDAATKSPGIGSSASQEPVQPASRHANGDTGLHLSLKTAATEDPGTDAVAAITSAPAVDPAASFAPASMLPVKLIEPHLAESSAQTTTSQVAPALISLATRTDGSNEMTVSLNPRDLGQVEIHLIRGADGTTTVNITASSPETLQELSQNVHHLHAALDAANIPTEGRSLSFNTTPVFASGQGQSDPSGRGASAAHDGNSGGSGSQDPGQERTWQQNRTARNEGDGAYIPPAPLVSRKSWQLSGLNITA